MHLIYGARIKYNLYHLIEGKASLDDIIVSLGKNISLITGGNGLEKIADLNHKDREFIVNKMIKLEEYADIILIDTGSGISKNVTMFFRYAQEVVVLLNPEVHSITDAFAIIKVISKLPDNRVINLVVNRVNSRFEANRVFRHLNNVSIKFLETKLNNLGYIYEDKNLKYAISKKEPISQCYPKSKYAKSIINIRNKILEKDKSSNMKIENSFFSKFKKLVNAN